MSYTVLHTHAGHNAVSEFLFDKLGAFGEFLDTVVLHSVLDTLKLLLLLFITYLVMELIEHKANARVRDIMQRSGVFGPIIGGFIGVVPQCGFSAAASNLYTGRVITLGTLIAVFLSTSDEMIPVLLAGNIKAPTLMWIIAYKTGVAIIMGFAIDIFLRLAHRDNREINIDEFCENDNCNCERGVFYSAFHHTLTTGTFILILTIVINTAMFFIGEENLSHILVNIPVLSHLICAVIGLIPSCAVSVALSTLASSGIITYGVMLSGLFSGAGVGLLVLFKVNKNKREILCIAFLLVAIATVFGALSELLPFV